MDGCGLNGSTAVSIDIVSCFYAYINVYYGFSFPLASCIASMKEHRTWCNSILFQKDETSFLWMGSCSLACHLKRFLRQSSTQVYRKLVPCSSASVLKRKKVFLGLLEFFCCFEYNDYMNFILKSCQNLIEISFLRWQYCSSWQFSLFFFKLHTSSMTVIESFF